MDGFGSHDQVMVIGATNKIELIDKSLLRPGRFDLKIAVTLPTVEEREEIIKIHLKAKSHNLGS